MSKTHSHGKPSSHGKKGPRQGHAHPQVEREVSGPQVMGFGLFRKHQKTLLWVAVIFTVLVFGLFTSMSDINSMLQGGTPESTVGVFTVPSTGETVEVDGVTFQRTRSLLGRFAYMNGVTEGATDDDSVWSHLMLMADAEAAGLRVTDGELANALAPLTVNLTSADYRNWVRSRGFTSAREFEGGLRQQLLVSKYSDLLRRESGVIPADEVYLRWKLDNERFDYEVLAFADLTADQIADPSADELQTYWDDMDVPTRELRFRTPAQRDLALAWLPLDTDLASLPGDKLAELAEPPEAVVSGRFNLVRAQRYPDVEEPDAEILATLALEQQLIGLAQRAQAAFLELDEEARTKQAFSELAADFGLTLVDPEGELSPPQIEALEDVGSPRLAGMVANAAAGTLRFAPPYGADTAIVLAFVEGGTEPSPMSYDEAHDLLVAAWKDTRKDQPAKDFLADLRAAAKALPAAAEELAALDGVAEERANASMQKRADAGEVLDYEAALADAKASLKPEIDARLDAFLGQVWDAVASQATGAEALSFTDVNKAWRFDAPEDADRTTLDWFLRTNAQIFNRGVGGVTPILRFQPESTSAVAHVTDIVAPEQAAMFEDPEGMARSRSNLAFQRLSEVYSEQLDPAAIIDTHDLQLADTREE